MFDQLEPLGEQAGTFFETHRPLLIGGVIGGICIASLFFVLFFANQPAAITITFLDSNHLPVEGVAVEWIGDNQLNQTTDSLGKVTFSVAVGSEGMIHASKAGYTTLEEKMIVTENRLDAILVMDSASESDSFSVSFAGTDNRKIVGKKVSGRLSCVNPDGRVLKPEFEIASDLDVTFWAQKECMSVIVTIMSPSEYAGFSYRIDPGANLLRLKTMDSRIAAQIGSVTVVLKGKETGQIASGNFEVVLFSGAKKIQSGVANNSKVSFSGLLPGDYRVLVHDQNGFFSEATSDRFTLEAQAKQEISIRLNKASDRIAFGLVEKGSLTPIRFGRVILKDNHGKVISSGVSDSEGNIVFGFDRTPESGLTVEAFASGYDLLVQSAGGLEKQTLELESTESDRLVKVLVKDDRGGKIENARVFAANADGAIFSAVSFVSTDSQGVAIFTGLSGEIRFFAEKGYLEGTSEVLSTNAQNQAIVVLKPRVFNGQVTVIDSSGAPVSDASVFVLGQTGTVLVSGTTNQQGRVVFDVSGNQEIFFKANHPEFGTVQSKTQLVLSDFSSTLEFSPLSSRGTLDILFEGFFNEQGKPVTEIVAGQNVIARFVLSIPTNSKKTGFFAVIGKQGAVQDEPAQIISTNAGPLTVTMGKQFSPTKPDSDLSATNLVDTNGKWIQCVQENPVFDFQRIEVTIAVDGKADSEEKIEVNYRGWVDMNGDLKTDPLAQLYSSNKTKALWNAPLKSVAIGVTNGMDGCESLVCLEDFEVRSKNYSSTEPPFVVEAGHDSTLEFSIRNPTPQQRTYAVSIEGLVDDEASTDLVLNNWKTTPSQTEEVTQNPLMVLVDSKKKVKAQADFRVNTRYPVSLLLDVFENGSPIASRTLDLESASNGELVIQPNQSIIPALTSNDISLVVTDKALGTPVSNVLVKVVRVSPDGSETISESWTDESGIIFLRLPSAPPTTVFNITAEINGYISSSISITVAELLSFNPPGLQSELSISSKMSESLSFEILNASDSDAIGRTQTLVGSFDGILDTPQMHTAMSGFTGLSIPKDSLTSASFTAIVHPGLLISSAYSAHGGIRMEFDWGEDTFVFVLPLSVAIRPEGSAIDTNGHTSNSCLVLNKYTWTGNTIENRSDFAFVLTNTCDTAFEALDGKVQWGSGETGSVELTINQSPTVALSEKEWSGVFSSFEKGTYSGLLTFTPATQELGRQAQFSVHIAGKPKSEGQRTEADPVSGLIAITNIENCITYSPHPGTGIRVPFEGDASFTVDSTSCGASELQVQLCPNDTGCSGGAPEGKINVTPTFFRLDESHPNQEIIVKGVDLPGTYEIPMAISLGNTAPSVVGRMAVVIEQNPADYLQLDKTDFFLKGASSTDSTRILNQNLSRPVRVQATAADWATLSADDLAALSAAGTGLTPEQIDDLNEGVDAAQQSAADLARETASQLEQAQQLADQAMQQTNQAAEKTSSAKDQIGQAAGMGSQATNMAMMLSTDCATVESACVTVLYPACQGVPAACAAAQSIFGAMQGAQGAQQAAAGAIDQAVQEVGPAGTAIAKGQNTILRIWFAGSNAVSSASQAQSQVNQAEQAAAVEESQDLSSEAANASGLSQSSCQSNQEAANQDQQASQSSGNSAMNLGMAGASIGMSITQAVSMEASMGSCTCPAAVALKQKFYAFKSVQTGLDGTNAAASSATEDEAQPAQDQAKMASDTASQAACSAGEALNRFADASEVVSDDLGGDENETTQNIAALLAAGVNTGYLNGIYSPGDLVTNTLTGYVINLKNDAKTVQPNTPKVTGRWSVGDAEVNGEYDSQLAGIVFENANLGEETVFATVVIDSNIHSYSDPAVVPQGLPDWGPYKLEAISQTTTHAQKFHMKFSGVEQTQSIANRTTDTTACQSGALLGRTGAGVLPRIKLRWNWTDIAIDSCDAKNPEYIYCDATQFSIMMTKRLQALQEFFAINPGFSCPQNQYAINLQEEMDGFNVYTDDAFSVSNYLNGCWLPKTTRGYDGKSALEYYIEASSGVRWTEAIPNQQALHDLLFFDAYLIQDGYSEDFIQDFSYYYSNVSFLDTPTYFFNDETGQNLNTFFDEGKITVRQKYSESVALPSSGRFAVTLDIDFENDAYSLFKTGNKSSANVVVNLVLKENPQLESPFYYLPFDGEVGRNGPSFERTGYGIGYQVITDDAFRISRFDEVHTRPDVTGASLQTVEVTKNTSFNELNAIPSKRGFILDVYQNSNTQKSMRFSPSLATPVLMKIFQEKSLIPFSALYSFRVGDQKIDVGDRSTFWSGAGTCLDFDNQPVSDNWSFSPDRRGRDTDRIDQAEDFYGIDWPAAERNGVVFLKTVFYAPIGTEYDLRAETNNVKFVSSDEPEEMSIKIAGIRTMKFNRVGGSDSDRITAIDDLFDLVSEEKVCVTDTGLRSSFWWNPEALSQETGLSGTSVKTLENSLQSSHVCR